MAENNSENHTLLSFITRDFSFERGHPLPMGSTLMRGGVNFSLFSKNAVDVSLVLFAPGQQESLAEFPLDPRYNRTGDIWHAFIGGLDPGVEYGYRIEGPENSHSDPRHQFDSDRIVLDPMAKGISGSPEWGIRNNDYRSLVVDDDFDWEHDQPLNTPLADSIIYELHVRGFTRAPSSGVEQPGSYAGLLEKIPYLQELGVTAVELLPVTEFDENDNPRSNPITGEPLCNFWGYHPISFMAPKQSYASYFDAIREFKTMVKALHQAGIEVILDVVFNHTGEGNEKGPTYSFRGIDNQVYYMLDEVTGKYHNYSGCGNTVNCNHPVVREMVLDCLRYWVTEMHVDGFRFDLASILGRGQSGEVLANPPLLEQIAADPVLAHTKLIAEAWDAAGLYQVGSFPAWGRWAEWNGKFRDDIRRFVRSESGMARNFATRLAGSPDLYQTSQRSPYHSINFITSHDGFTLRDLVSYDHKHNEMNGEENRDGDNDNHSWNCGEEGPSDSVEINQLRNRQVRNFLTLLLVSRGVPMILAGDELGRTQNGNNNAYCQDNELSWLDWRSLEEDSSLFIFMKRLIAFRKHHSLIRHESFTQEADGSGPCITWHGTTLHQPDWSSDSRSLAMHLSGWTKSDGEDHIYLIANSYWEPISFQLPDLETKRWHRFVDTQMANGGEISEPGEETLLPNQSDYHVGSRSIVVLVGR